MVICRDVQMMKEGALVPKYASGNSKSGKITAWVSCGSHDKWECCRDQESRLVAVPDGEWKGSLETGKQSFILFTEDIPYVPIAPKELGVKNGLQLISQKASITISFFLTVSDERSVTNESCRKIWVWKKQPKQHLKPSVHSNLHSLL